MIWIKRNIWFRRIWLWVSSISWSESAFIWDQKTRSSSLWIMWFLRRPQRWDLYIKNITRKTSSYILLIAMKAFMVSVLIFKSNSKSVYNLRSFIIWFKLCIIIIIIINILCLHWVLIWVFGSNYINTIFIDFFDIRNHIKIIIDFLFFFFSFLNSLIEMLWNKIYFFPSFKTKTNGNYN